MEKIIVLGNGTDWLDESYKSLKTRLYFNNDIYPVVSKSKFCSFFIRFAFCSKRIAQWKIFAPLKTFIFSKSVFLRFYTKKENLLFLIYDHNIASRSVAYLLWIRKKFPSSTICLLFTNIIERSGLPNKLNNQKLFPLFDSVFCFDLGDALAYRANYYQLVYEPLCSASNDPIQFDCLFVGQAKERLQKLYRVYRRLVYLGLRPLFFITGVPENEKIVGEGLVFNHPLPYGEVIRLVCHSKCILDLMQTNSSGVTLRVAEAARFNKLLITDNSHLLEESFYNSDMVCVIKHPEDISRDFFERDGTFLTVTDSFSLDRLLLQIQKRKKM